VLGILLEVESFIRLGLGEKHIGLKSWLFKKTVLLKGGHECRGRLPTSGRMFSGLQGVQDKKKERPELRGNLGLPTIRVKGEKDRV